MFNENRKSSMDWAGAIACNSEALKGVIEVLFAMLGLGSGDTQARISMTLYRAVLRLLQPAESALRRLIVIAARGLVVKVTPSRPMGVRPISRPVAKKKRMSASFQLFDTRKDFTRGYNRVFDQSLLSQPERMVDTAPLTQRLQILTSALEDLPRHAMRFARWRIRRENLKSPKFTSPFRPGPPPGHRKKKTHEVDELLTECHALACYAMKPDTS